VIVGVVVGGVKAISYKSNEPPQKLPACASYYQSTEALQEGDLGAFNSCLSAIKGDAAAINSEDRKLSI